MRTPPPTFAVAPPPSTSRSCRGTDPYPSGMPRLAALLAAALITSACTATGETEPSPTTTPTATPPPVTVTPGPTVEAEEEVAG